MRKGILIIVLTLIFTAFNITSCDKREDPKVKITAKIMNSESGSEQMEELDDDSQEIAGLNEMGEEPETQYEETDEEMLDEETEEFDEESSDIAGINEMYQELETQNEETEEKILDEETEGVEDESSDIRDSVIGIEHEYEKTN
ncbi:hypothetical protein ACFL1Z_04540 [Thermodesulfobacteriota bacterium]